MAEEVGFEPTNPFGLSVFKTDAFNRTQPPLHRESNLTMNRFVLDLDPKVAAEYHCNKHVVKMIIEYAQLMSTAHRMLDGKEYVDNSSGRKIKRWRLNDHIDSMIYKASHVNHPFVV